MHKSRVQLVLSFDSSLLQYNLTSTSCEEINNTIKGLHQGKHLFSSVIWNSVLRIFLKLFANLKETCVF